MIELRVNFHRQLEAIEAKVIQLFALVAEDLQGVTHALLADEDVLDVVIDRERLIDALYKEIESSVNQQLARQAPVARDLRCLVSVLRIVPELERSHDLVVHLARQAGDRLGGELRPRVRGLIQQMGDTASEMWRIAADSWYQRDGSTAARLESRDDVLDRLHAEFVSELASGRNSLPVIMNLILVGRFYERLGDHAVNVARRVLYLAGPPTS